MLATRAPTNTALRRYKKQAGDVPLYLRVYARDLKKKEAKIGPGVMEIFFVTFAGSFAPSHQQGAHSQTGQWRPGRSLCFFRLGIGCSDGRAGLQGKGRVKVKSKNVEGGLARRPGRSQIWLFIHSTPTSRKNLRKKAARAAKI